MVMEENYTAKEESLSKALYKLVLLSIKAVPIIISVIYVINTVLSYFGIDLPLLSYVVQYLFIAFMYLASYAFRFCRWHRMFIHYITLVFTLNIYDYHFGLPITDRGLLLFYCILTGVFLLVTVYLRFHTCRH